MGLFNSLIQLRNTGYPNALNPTGNGVFTPSSPGRLDHVRSTAIVPNTRSFTPVEASQLTAYAEQRQAIATASEEAYTALQSIEESDTRITKSNRKYRLAVAKFELQKKRSDAKYLSGLNQLRGGYSEAGAMLLESRKKSDERLAVIEARTRQILKGY